jgi:hypothetical protein
MSHRWPCLSPTQTVDFRSQPLYTAPSQLAQGEFGFYTYLSRVGGHLLHDGGSHVVEREGLDVLPGDGQEAIIAISSKSTL